MAPIRYLLPAVATFALGGPVVPGLPAQATGMAPSGGIIGRVIDQQSLLPVGGAAISLVGVQRRTSTDSAGRFTQAGLGPGTYLLEVRAIGYGVTSWVLRLKEGEVVEHVFAVAPLGVELEPVTVRARPGLAERRLQEFEERRRGGRGVFITQEQIERGHAASLGDLLRGVPGVRLNCRSRICTAQMTRGARGICAADWVIDGMPASNSSSPAMPVVGIVAIEIYRSPNEAPPEFLKSDSQCGVIVIWTKSGP